MRFSTGLTLAATLLGVSACDEYSRRPHGHRHSSGGVRSTAVATAVTTLVPSTSRAAATTFSTVTKPVDITSKSSSIVIATTKPADVTSKSSSIVIATTTTKAAVTTSSASSTSAAATTSAASSSGLTTDQQNALDAQNSARSDVGSAALVWDSGLASEAQTWAEHLVSVGDLVHSEISNEGENLYQGYDGTPFLDAANAWLSEKSSYGGEVITETNYMTFGHYTQIVWSTTTKVGMGLATGSNGATYVVARYSLPGNYIGETAY